MSPHVLELLTAGGPYHIWRTVPEQVGKGRGRGSDGGRGTHEVAFPRSLPVCISFLPGFLRSGLGCLCWLSLSGQRTPWTSSREGLEKGLPSLLSIQGSALGMRSLSHKEGVRALWMSGTDTVRCRRAGDTIPAPGGALRGLRENNAGG